MRNIALKLLFILLILAACAYAIYPPQEKIRLGKDLRGGVSLIYSVRMDPDVRDRQEVLRQTITVLQDRINPRGVLDISMEPVGDDRIEVVMPLPTPEVLALRQAYEAQLETLLAEAQIPAARLDAALRQGRAPVELGGDLESERGSLMVDLQRAYDDLQSARTQLNELRGVEGTDPRQIAQLELAVAEAMIDHEELRDRVLRMSLDRSRVLSVLTLPDTREPVRGTDGRPLEDSEGRVIREPSQREVALEALKSEFPQLADALDRTVAAADAYEARRAGFDDPEDLKRLLRGAGVLEFRIAVRPGAEDVSTTELRRQLRERGPENVDSTIAGWFEINNLSQWYRTPEELQFLQADPVTFFQGRDLVAAERDGRYYLLLYTSTAKSITHGGEHRWSIRRAAPDLDQQGRRAVSFELDSTGGALMSRLTGPHIGEPMAIVLDGQVYSAPNLLSQIGSRGIIQGTFTPQDISYLVRVLAAGALEARLSENPIAENNLGPSIGADNLRRGLEAFVVALIAIAIFMTIYYFLAGIVAVFALLANGLIIFGVMSGMDGTFTLPGLAGIVLTIGMAVDANVLIYERIREEMFTGEYDLRGAVRQGYAKALSTILDANITNLIVCLVLFQTATAEVRGFALTLTIGICATLFTSLFVTRVIYALYTDVFKAKSLPMLPTVFPAIHHALEPAINWVSFRKIFWGISLVAMIGSIALVASRGTDMIDTELRGGVAVTLRTAVSEEDGGERYWLRHVGPNSVEQRIRAIAERAEAMPVQTEADAARQAVLREFANASVLTVGQTRLREGLEAQSFQIKVPNPTAVDDDMLATDAIVRAVVEEFEHQLDVTPPLSYTGEGDTNHTQYTFPIEYEELGQNIGRTRYTERVAEYLGGVAIVIDDISPSVTVDDVRMRIDRMRGQPDFSIARGRDFEVIGLERADENDPRAGYTSLAVVVADPTYSYLRMDTDFSLWDSQLAAVEWELVTEALSRPPSLEQVASISAAMARSLAAAAQVAVIVSLLGILLYIWVRFGSLRYSAAAIVALVHDVVIALGVLAATAYVGRTAFGSMLLVEEFRIDMGVVAALLTIIGYSLNDTIVILDRIRENRGKLPVLNAATVNRSINQTFSRTVITSLTTLLAVGIMYIEGGSGIRAFAFCLLMGLIIGTYSSVAIAAPLVYDEAAERKKPAVDAISVGEEEPVAP